MSHKELDVSNSSVPVFYSKNIVLTDVLFPLDYLCNRGAISMLAVTSGVQLLPSFNGPQFYPLTLVMTHSTLCSISALQTPTSSSSFFFSLFSTKTYSVSDPTSISSVSDPRRTNRSVLQVVLSDICIPVETDSPTHTTSSLLTGTLTHRDDGS